MRAQYHLSSKYIKVNKGLSYQILESSFRTFTYIKLQLCEKVLLKEIYFY